MDLPKIPRLFSNKNWHECYLSWMRALYAKSNSLDTLYTYQRIMIDFFVPGRHPGKCHRRDIEAFIDEKTHGNQRSGTAPAAATRKKRLAILASFFNHAQGYLIEFRKTERPLLASSPCAGIEAGGGSGQDRDIEDEEVKRLFALIPRDTRRGKRDLALLLTYISTSRRRSEVTNLRWRDIEETTFSDGRQGWVYTFKSKGRIERETAELPEVAFLAIKEYLIADERWDQMQPDWPVFRGLKWKDTLNRAVATQTFKRYARKAKLPESCCLHSLRHYAAWEMYIFSDHNIMAVAELLRHENVQVTLDYIKKRQRKKAGNPTASRLAQKYASL